MKKSKRLETISVTCPTCGALPSFTCSRVNGKARIALHRDRYAKAEGQAVA